MSSRRFTPEQTAWIDAQVLEAIGRIYASYRTRLSYDPGAREPVVTASMLAVEVPFGWMPSAPYLEHGDKANAAQAALTRLYHRGALLRSEAVGFRGKEVFAYELAPEGTTAVAHPKKSAVSAQQKATQDLLREVEAHGWEVKRHEKSARGVFWSMFTRVREPYHTMVMVEVGARGKVEGKYQRSSHYSYSDKPYEKSSTDIADVLRWLKED